MLGLAQSLPSPQYASVFLSFAERGLCRPFLAELRRNGTPAIELRHNAPHLAAAAGEVADRLSELGADVLCCHGYKPDLIGWLAGRRAGVPVVAVSRGWTAATAKVRLYEALDRRILRWMDRVVCVSQGQAAKVRRGGVPSGRVVVIRNAIRAERFLSPDPSGRQRLAQLFAPGRPAPELIVCAAGRLSPEKGFAHLVSAAAIAVAAEPSAGFVLFGDGPLREALERQIASLGLEQRFILAGFRQDVDGFIPHADLVVLPSLTEGLPNVALEASAAAVPVVATAVGGTPEVVVDGFNGYLVRPADPEAMARRIVDLLRSPPQRAAMGRAGCRRIAEQFTFEAQSAQYQRLFASLVKRPVCRGRVPAGASPEVCGPQQ